MEIYTLHSNNFHEVASKLREKLEAKIYIRISGHKMIQDKMIQDQKLKFIEVDSEGININDTYGTLTIETGIHVFFKNNIINLINKDYETSTTYLITGE